MNIKVLRRLFDLAWPVIGLNVLNVLALAVDTAMCGRLDESDAALAGLGFATQLVFLLLIAMLGLSVGAVALVARAHGAEDNRRRDHLLRQSVTLTLIVSATVAIFGNLIASPLLSLLGAEGQALRLGVDYLRPIFTGTVFYYLNLLYAGLLRGVGNTRIPLATGLVSNLFNVVANYGLILGNFGLPALGVEGAAIGTVLSQALATVLLFACLNLRKRPILFFIRPARVDLKLAWELFRVGAPAALDLLVINAAFLSIVGMLGRIDEAAVAAHGVGLRIQALAFVPGLSVSQATGALIGQSLGSGDVKEARSIVYASIFLCTCIMSCLAIFFISQAAPVVGFFDIQPETTLQRLSVMWVQLLGYGMPIVGVHIAFVGLFRGSGDTTTSLLINAVTTALQVPASWFLGFTLAWGAFGVWVAFPLSFAAKALLGYLAFKKERWARTGLRV